jgi:RNA-binding protein
MPALFIAGALLMALQNESKSSGKKPDKHLRRIGHQLKPVVTIASKGLSENVLTETQRALDDHELIKVKVVTGNRQMRQLLIEELCEATGAELIQAIGNVALILRRNKKANPLLSNLERFKV